ncbi:hypothetical protein [Vampirovibrio sp.]|uniref:hypothetical protein n=1 Tax=Vampirovibrio sp. TaxID=2717857 RepID=UPI003592F533
MSRLIEPLNEPDIVISDTLGPAIRRMVEAAKSYDTVILLYEDDFSDNILASWAELDRLDLRTRVVGIVSGGLQVHSFGMPAFSPGSVIEIHLREVGHNGNQYHPPKAAYKSLLNEVCLISVKQYECQNSSLMLQ